jgi:hypothetical protein
MIVCDSSLVHLYPSSYGARWLVVASVEAEGLDGAEGRNAYIAVPNIFEGFDLERQTWKRPCFMPHWQRRVRETRFRTGENWCGYC